MNPQNIRCMKMHMINAEKVDLEPALAGKLLTHTMGMHAGGQTDKDLMDCPKQGQPQYEVCKDCQFSVPMDASMDMFGV
ncbi:MAG: hypothetical protein Q8P59_03005 [Dehalococcoidia bacterium]|nr:hypothetical protein [Dehalococcoidia bacterium]